MAPIRPQRGPTIAPGGLQGSSQRVQHGPKSVPRGPQGGPKTGQDAPKVAPGGHGAEKCMRMPQGHHYAARSAKRPPRNPQRIRGQFRKAKRGFRSDLRHLSRIFTRFLYSQRRFPFIAPKGFLPYQADPLQKRGFSRGPQTETKKRPKIDPKIYKKRAKNEPQKSIKTSQT